MNTIKIKLDELLKCADVLKTECADGYVRLEILNSTLTIESSTKTTDHLKLIIYSDNLNLFPKRIKEERL